MGEAIDYRLEIASRLRLVGRPGFGHEPRADTEAQRGLRRRIRPLQPDRLADEAALGEPVSGIEGLEDEEPVWDEDDEEMAPDLAEDDADDVQVQAFIDRANAAAAAAVSKRAPAGGQDG